MNPITLNVIKLANHPAFITTFEYVYVATEVSERERSTAQLQKIVRGFIARVLVKKLRLAAQQHSIGGDDDDDDDDDDDGMQRNYPSTLAFNDHKL